MIVTEVYHSFKRFVLFFFKELCLGEREGSDDGDDDGRRAAGGPPARTTGQDQPNCSTVQ